MVYFNIGSGLLNFICMHACSLILTSFYFQFKGQGNVARQRFFVNIIKTFILFHSTVFRL